ncbi:MAG: hypothetical protein J0I48_01090 [Devosia sp.]|uniref:hypothetical protein n=1 Tax=Devosia sp. 66-22 TaxID=1895753 RepID=UPI0009279FD1|nr:hypothetical protein [Devosia sp. 66-22]MBN9344782.1 hypothetical protein [Devosia sp.]OJX50313.1 MAG: hypothetical protein BGO81_04320 [Devosia sp. 66-22]
MKVLRWIAVLGLVGVTSAYAQQAPMPRPAPQFLAPLATEAAPPAEAPSETPAAPATATAAIETVTSDPQPVVLTAMVTDGGRQIDQGLVWRVFTTKTDTAGQLELAAKSDSPVARFSLSPGNYVVHVAYGRAQASDTITVAEGSNSKNIVLEAGGLRLNAAVTGDVPIPINLLHFDVLTAGTSDADRAMVAQGISANDILTVNAGTYHIVSYFGAVNAVVRADLRVEPGQLTDATLYHRAAQTSFKLVSEAGGEAIADVDWTVKTTDGTTIFTDTGAFPSTVLQEGDYLVLAKRGDTVFNREFEVTPGQPREIEVLTTVY